MSISRSPSNGAANQRAPVSATELLRYSLRVPKDIIIPIVCEIALSIQDDKGLIINATVDY